MTGDPEALREPEGRIARNYLVSRGFDGGLASEERFVGTEPAPQVLVDRLGDDPARTAGRADGSRLRPPCPAAWPQRRAAAAAATPSRVGRHADGTSPRAGRMTSAVALSVW